MDIKTAEIVRAPEEDLRKIEALRGRRLIPLTEEQANELEPLGARQRKNNMRNKPCVCGSGKKFKRCCWRKYEHQTEN